MANPADTDGAAGSTLWVNSFGTISWVAGPGASGALLLGQAGTTPTWLAAGTSGYLLQANGAGANPTWVTPPAAFVKATYFSTFDGVNTLAAFNLINQSIPSGTMGANSTILVFVEGDYLNNSGAARGLTMLVSFGGTTMWSDVSSGTAIAASASHRSFNAFFQIQNENSVTSQRLAGNINVSNTTAGSVAGLGVWNQSPVLNPMVGGTSAVNTTTTAQTLLISATHSTNNASLEFKGAVTALVV